MTQGQFVYAEKAACAVLGLPKKRVRALRRECPGLRGEEHFTIVNRLLVYTEKGARLLIEAAGMGNGSVEELLRRMLVEGNGSCTGETGTTAIVHVERPVCEMQVWRTDLKNPRILMALLGGVQQRVSVQNSKNFVRGMRIKARRIQSDLWQLIGRCPRYRGRW